MSPPSNAKGAVVINSETEYAQRRKQHLALINQLRAIGAQAELDLPRVAVIGNQSAGKSSLVEAISGITVPRDAGTCTRCPMECRLASSTDPWTCQLSIRREVDPHTNKPAETVVEEPFGPQITNKADVESMLRRAQAAVLNPKVPTKAFLDASIEQISKHKNELLFSKNVVCVDLSGPDLTDLAFVDLPGIIQNAEAETVQLVENLVKSHIKGNCLILVTLPMSDDIENQKAMQLAKQVDPNGLRTIGVMTKPDTLPPGATKSRELWLDVIEGRRYHLKHGYYCTRQPDDEERSKNITAAQAREAETKFFKTTSPWNRSKEPHRFGTNQLVLNISKLLTQIIYDTMPKLRREAASQLQACIDRLNELPPAITADPTSYVLNLITTFCHDVKLHVDGDSSYAGLVQQNRFAYAAFKRDIRSTAPLFLPLPSVPKRRDQTLVTSLDDDDSDDDDDLGETPPTPTPEGGTVTHSSTPAATPRFITLQDLRAHIRKSLGKELPGNVPYGAKVSLIRNFQVSWEMYSQKCFDAVFKTFDREVIKLVGKRFDRYETLKFVVIQATKELLNNQKNAAWNKILDILANEKSPYTQNTHYLQESKAKHLTRYKDLRAKNPTTDGEPALKRRKTGTGPTDSVASKAVSTPTKAPADASSQAKQLPSPRPSIENTGAQKRVLELDDVDSEKHVANVLASLAVLFKRSFTQEDLARLLPPDIYEDELEVMAEVRAYFQVAYKRMIDFVPMTIDDKFLGAFRDALQAFLLQRLALGGPDSASRCTAYLAEDPAVVAERDELISRRRKLELVQAELFSFGVAV